MDSKTVAMLACVASLALTEEASAAGCLKGGAAGGVAGYFVGNNRAVLGAAGGCVVGRHVAKKKAKEDAARAEDEQPQTQAAQ